MQGLGKPQLLIGSAPDCDIVVAGPGVAPRHARIVNQGGGALVFVDDGQGASFANGAPLAPGQPVAFDFRTAFVVGQVPVPLAHPAIALMLLGRGAAAAGPRVTIGREASRVMLALQHPAVSALHAELDLERMTLQDLGSTGGVWIAGQRLTPQQPVQLDPSTSVAFGPIVMPAGLLVQVARGLVAPAGAPVAGPTPAGAPPPGAVKHQTIVGQLDFRSGPPERSIGRTPDNDIVVAHPQVSSRHAALVKSGDALFLEDRGSANGTFVRGQRLAPGQRVPVVDGEKIYVGPMPLVVRMAGGAASTADVVIDDAAQWAGQPLYEIEAWDLFLQVPDRDDPGTMKTLLDHVSFKALPGDMIALMGPSGAGKTTLLLALNGYLPPTAGQVRVNGEDLYLIYDALRGSIGYVPQDDIVHPELTVFEAVRYSARFRLPPDYSDEEIDRRVDTTLAQLSLEQVRNLQIGKPEKKVLSGGQRKRVNIAMELVTDPVILFLDEPTSGLAADDATSLILLLSELAKKTGKTIVMTIHQPAKDEFEKFNLALVMGYGGVPMFYGPTSPDAYRFFGSWNERQGKPVVDTPRDMFDMITQREKAAFDAVRAEDPSAPRWKARGRAAKEWNAEFFRQDAPTFQKMYSGRRAVGTEPTSRGVPHRSATTKGQLGLLLSRYAKIKARDVTGAAIMFLQAPIIGVLLALVFGRQKSAVPAWCLGPATLLQKQLGATVPLDPSQLPTTHDNVPAIFFLVVAAVWFGTSNAAREIVSERAVYMRERMVNLGLFQYVLSKYALLTVVCIVQCTLLLGIVFVALGFGGGPVAFVTELLMLIVTAMCAVAIGLLLSTVVMSSEAAMALTPIALIPQVVLGGLMVPMTTNPDLKWLMAAIPARWGLQGLVAQERAAIAAEDAWSIDLKLKDATMTSSDLFVKHGHFDCAIAQVAADDRFSGALNFTGWDQAWQPVAVLLGMTFAAMAVLLVVLKRRDPV